jgi:hypothetical protein
MGLVIGAAIGGWHVLWGVLVATRLAQPLIYYILYFHFLTVPVRVAPFDFPRALVLIVLTSAFGFLLGVLIAWLWNATFTERRRHGRNT